MDLQLGRPLRFSELERESLELTSALWARILLIAGVSIPAGMDYARDRSEIVRARVTWMPTRPVVPGVDPTIEVYDCTYCTLGGEMLSHHPLVYAEGLGHEEKRAVLDSLPADSVHVPVFEAACMYRTGAHSASEYAIPLADDFAGLKNTTPPFSVHSGRFAFTVPVLRALVGFDAGVFMSQLRESTPINLSLLEEALNTDRIELQLAQGVSPSELRQRAANSVNEHTPFWAHAVETAGFSSPLEDTAYLIEIGKQLESDGVLYRVP